MPSGTEGAHNYGRLPNGGSYLKNTVKRKLAMDVNLSRGQGVGGGVIKTGTFRRLLVSVARASARADSSPGIHLSPRSRSGY